jgi:ATP-dependent RNA helicase DDX24/MAK5
MASIQSHKRKASTNRSLARKKVKTQHKNTDELPWKIVSRPLEAGLGGDEGILDFEEVDDVEVVYEEINGGKRVKFNVR